MELTEEEQKRYVEMREAERKEMLRKAKIQLERGLLFPVEYEAIVGCGELSTFQPYLKRRLETVEEMKAVGLTIVEGWLEGDEVWLWGVGNRPYASGFAWIRRDELIAAYYFGRNEVKPPLDPV